MLIMGRRLVPLFGRAGSFLCCCLLKFLGMAFNMLLKPSSRWFCSHETGINHKVRHAVTCQFQSNLMTPPPPPPLRPPRPAPELANAPKHLPLRDENLRSNVTRMLSCETSNQRAESMALQIDVLQRFGIDHHFSEAIETKLNFLHRRSTTGSIASCGEAALAFRLLRQAGYQVSSDIFCRFLDGRGEFAQELKEDTEGLINLYEASFLNTGDEDILYKAQEFSREHLVSSLPHLGPNLATRVRQTLELPYHMTLQRYKARQYLDQEHDGETGSWMKQLARSDFMQLQTLHQNELDAITSWWKKSSLGKDLWFARDQPLKWYVWSMAIIPDARYSEYRILLTKVITFVYLIDDIYDVHGSAGELALFKKALGKWDLTAIESLPAYMRACYTALYRITSEVAEMVTKEHGWNPIDTLIQSWVDLCHAFSVESKWFASNHVPSSDVYLRNGITSSGTHVVLVHLFALIGEGMTKDNARLVDELLSYTATILRLSDDLGSAKDENQEGFDGSYLECYKKENPQCTEEGAREEVERKIGRAWEELNRECLSSSSPLSKVFRTACLNAARTVKVMYTYTDDQKLPMLQDCVDSLLFRTV